MTRLDLLLVQKCQDPCRCLEFAACSLGNVPEDEWEYGSFWKPGSEFYPKVWWLPGSLGNNKVGTTSEEYGVQVGMTSVVSSL